VPSEVIVAAIRAELLYTTDCPHAERAEAQLRRILSEEDVDAAIERIPIDDLDHAAGLGFHGSPTIRLDGVDVASGEGDVGLACRIYRDPDGSVDTIPSEAVVRAAVRARVGAREPGRGPLGRARELPARLMRAGFVWASGRESLERISKRLPLTRRLVDRFVAGEDLATALVALGRLRDAGLATTVDLLGESVDSERAAITAADDYVRLLEALQEQALDGNVSLKLTQMGLDIDPGLCLRNVERVVEAARASEAFVRIDMEDHTRTDRTLSIGRELHARHGNVGVVIQSYLRRSEADVEALIAQRIRVRLCKGAYNEPADVAYASKAEVDRSYVRLMERLLRDGTYPGIATHDERIIDRARDFVAGEGIGTERFEFQMLYGVRRDLQDLLAKGGDTVRVYVPCGAEWYPYFMRRLAERPANVLFLLRNLLREGRR
jgi:proline dehydrogenase